MRNDFFFLLFVLWALFILLPTAWDPAVWLNEWTEPTSRPSCFASKPSAQDQAERSCHDCKFRPQCFAPTQPINP